MQMGICEVSFLSESKVHNVEKIVNKAFFFPYGEKSYAIPLLHQ